MPDGIDGSSGGVHGCWLRGSGVGRKGIPSLELEESGSVGKESSFSREEFNFIFIKIEVALFSW